MLGEAARGSPSTTRKPLVRDTGTTGQCWTIRAELAGVGGGHGETRNSQSTHNNLMAILIGWAVCLP